MLGGSPERPLVGDEEERGGNDVVLGRVPAERVAPRRRRHDLLRRDARPAHLPVEHLLPHPRRRAADRADAVRRRPARRELDCERLGEADQSELRRAVRLQPGEAAPSGVGRDGHDPSAPARGERGRRGLRDEERALQVDVERQVPVRLRHLAQRLDVDHAR